jgi:hypothetical protein
VAPTARIRPRFAGVEAAPSVVASGRSRGAGASAQGIGATTRQSASTHIPICGCAEALVERKSGDDLLSQGVSPQVPSALAVFTAVFGMGTGVSPPL